MKTRRKFIETGIAGLAGLILLPAINAFANDKNHYKKHTAGKLKLRFAVASDLHYGEPEVDYIFNTKNMVKWLNEDSSKNQLNLVIINGDLVHNRPDLLSEVKENYLDKITVPSYAIPGNHDFANATVWKTVFGYEDNYFFEKNDVAFLLVNTADVTGQLVKPDNVFIKNALENFKDKKIVFVIMHVPPVQWLKREKEYFTDSPETIDLFHQYPNVKAVFHGHDHYLDDVRYSEKLYHFFDSHIGSNWGTLYRGYKIVEVDQENNIYTYQVNASQNPILNSNKL